MINNFLKKIKYFIYKKVPKRLIKNFEISKSDIVSMNTDPLNNGGFKIFFINSELWRTRIAQNNHEIPICNWFKENLKKEDIFYDIGSLIGYFPMLINSIISDVNIHCFEPNWISRYVIEINKKVINGNWKINGGFVSSDKKQTNKFGVRNLDYYDNYSISIDNYIIDNPPPTVLKMDIDGAEILALKGMKNLISMKKTKFLIEIHPVEIKKMGYDVNKDLISLFKINYGLSFLPFLRSDNDKWVSQVNSSHLKDDLYMLAIPKN